MCMSNADSKHAKARWIWPGQDLRLDSSNIRDFQAPFFPTWVTWDVQWPTLWLPWLPFLTLVALPFLRRVDACGWNSSPCCVFDCSRSSSNFPTMAPSVDPLRPGWCRNHRSPCGRWPWSILPVSPKMASCVIPHKLALKWENHLYMGAFPYCSIVITRGIQGKSTGNLQETHGFSAMARSWPWSLHFRSTSSSWWQASWRLVQFNVSLPTRNSGCSSFFPSAQASPDEPQTPQRSGQFFRTWLRGKYTEVDPKRKLCVIFCLAGEPWNFRVNCWFWLAICVGLNMILVSMDLLEISVTNWFRTSRKLQRNSNPISLILNPPYAPQWTDPKLWFIGGA